MVSASRRNPKVNFAIIDGMPVEIWILELNLNRSMVFSNSWVREKVNRAWIHEMDKSKVQRQKSYIQLFFS